MDGMKILVATAIYPTAENPAFGSFVRTQVESLRDAGVEIELLVLSGRPRKLIYPRGIVQLNRRLAAGDVDLVHAHYSYVGMVARAQWKVPVVVTFHGSDILGGVNASGRRPRFDNLITRAGRLLGEFVDAVIVQSPEMAAKFRRRDVHIIPHEIDFSTFRLTDREEARATLGLDSERKYLLFAADPQNHVKRFPLAQEAASILRQRDPSVELCIVHKETQDRLALYMNACDALVFPSYQEGSPNIVKQAMACNLPIVATDVGDVRQVIAGTSDCFVCEPDAEVFAERLAGILLTGQRTDGRSRIRHLDRPVVARKLIDVYEDVISRNASRRRVRTESVSSPSPNRPK
jgi:teichuronic acid biosynthesis glycosyltransferase TuaC